MPVHSRGVLTGRQTNHRIAKAVSGHVVVGSSTTAIAASSWAFEEDLSTSNPVMRSLGSLGGHSEDAAHDIDSNIVVGRADRVANLRPHAFAYDLGSTAPRMADLGPGSVDWDVHVSGHIAAGLWTRTRARMRWPGGCRRPPPRRCGSPS